MAPDRWFLTPTERGNPATGLDRRHPEGRAFTTGNDVAVLVHGVTYFRELLRCVRGMRASDLLLFSDWRGDPDERLDGPETAVASVFARAAERGVVVKGLIWRSHLDRLAFSEEQNRHLGEDIEAAGGQGLLDMRVRLGGSHHQKFVVLRHPGRPELDVAFVGGIDLCHSRRDDGRHGGDPQPQPFAKVYGRTPPWHDVQLAIRGPAVGDVEAVFRERWCDPAPLTRNPIHRLGEALRHEDHVPGPLPPQLPDPEERGHHQVQILRTYPKRRPGYPFAPEGERSIARAYLKAVARATGLIYLEDQYLWSAEVVRCFADALRAHPGLRLIAVVPHEPDQDGRVSRPPNLVGRIEALAQLHAAARERVSVYGVENEAGTPVYVHAKVCVVDDVWASVGSDNINRRSWTHDSELSCAVVDEKRDPREPARIAPDADGARTFARDLRLQLGCEHLGRDPSDVDDLLDPGDAFAAFANSAACLQRWHDSGRVGPRPVGRLRPYATPRLGAVTARWAGVLSRLVFDPDGRPARLRRSGQF